MFSRTTTKSMSLGPLVLERRLDARVELHRAQVDVLVELEAQPEQDALLEDAGLHVGMADRAEEDRVEAPQLLGGALRQHLAGAQIAVAAEIEFATLDRSNPQAARRARSTFTASAVTSGPVPSPGIIAILYKRSPSLLLEGRAAHRPGAKSRILADAAAPARRHARRAGGTATSNVRVGRMETATRRLNRTSSQAEHRS